MFYKRLRPVLNEEIERVYLGIHEVTENKVHDPVSPAYGDRRL
jgi:hypothetical protein